MHWKQAATFALLCLAITSLQSMRKHFSTTLKLVWVQTALTDKQLLKYFLTLGEHSTKPIMNSEINYIHNTNHIHSWNILYSLWKECLGGVQVIDVTRKSNACFNCLPCLYLNTVGFLMFIFFIIIIYSLSGEYHYCATRTGYKNSCLDKCSSSFWSTTWLTVFLW